METSRYKLIRIIDNELKSEIDYHPNLNSNEINRKILEDKFQYNEQNCKLFLHKKMHDYYILINFSYILPQTDKKYVYQLMNDNMKNYRDNIQNKTMFHKAIGLHDNSEIKESSKIIYQPNNYFES